MIAALVFPLIKRASQGQKLCLFHLISESWNRSLNSSLMYFSFLNCFDHWHLSEKDVTNRCISIITFLAHGRWGNGCSLFNVDKSFFSRVTLPILNLWSTKRAKTNYWKIFRKIIVNWKWNYKMHENSMGMKIGYSQTNFNLNVWLYIFWSESL